MKPGSRCARSAAMIAVLALAACAPALRGSTAQQVDGLHGRDAEVVLYSGERVLLRSPRVEGDSVFGGWQPGPGGDVRVAVALADIQSVRTVSDAPNPLVPQGLVERWIWITLIAVGALMLLLAAGESS